MSVPRHLLHRPRRGPPPVQRGQGRDPAPEILEAPEAVAEVHAEVHETIVEAPEAPTLPEAVADAPEVAPILDAAPEAPTASSEDPLAPTPLEGDADLPLKPAWNVGMKKSDLLAYAASQGLSLTEENTKAEIVDALRKIS